MYIIKYLVPKNASGQFEFHIRLLSVNQSILFLRFSKSERSDRMEFSPRIMEYSLHVSTYLMHP